MSFTREFKIMLLVLCWVFTMYSFLIWLWGRML